MDDINPINVPFIVHEGILARQERVIKRLWILCIIIFLAFIISNCLWLYHDQQCETVVVTQENEDGYNNFIGNDGEIVYGEADN